MKLKIYLLCILLLGFGCATYKQLKPKPELSYLEQGYIELKQDKDNFELKKDKKYFIIFPGPTDDHFYLILNLPEKKQFGSFLTSTLLKKKIVGIKIPDEAPSPENTSVYPIDKSYPQYFWIIDNVPEDIVLKMQYRYAPQWRFKFETQYARFQKTFKKNRVDRGIYKGIGTTANFNGFNFPLVIDTVSKHTAALDSIHKELLAIESIFPASILNSNDQAYKNYVSFRKELEGEMAFQASFKTVLNFFYAESQCKDNVPEFLSRIEDFINYFADKEHLPPNILKESQTLITNRINEIRPFYDNRLSAKDDAQMIDPEYFRLKGFNRLGALYQAIGIPVPQEYVLLAKFVNDFNLKSKALLTLQDSLQKISEDIKNQPGMPSDDFFRNIVNRMIALEGLIPQALDQQYGKYITFACATSLNNEILNKRSSFGKLKNQYEMALSLVTQLNVFKSQNNYSAMLAILKQNLNLTFLIEKYKDLDKMSLDEQVKGIRASFAENLWQQAETGLTKLYNDVNFLNLSEIQPLKGQWVHNLEDTLYLKVEQLTRTKVNKFLEEKVNVLENVDSLYTDSVFLPAYNITFSSGGRNNLVQRKNNLIADLAKMKSNEFPSKAIKLLYEQFIKSPDDNGVLKCRAIVTHGNYYQGNDKEIKLRIAECNPLLAKAITRPKDYRRVFVLPISDNRAGKNKYVVRFNINIPTEAAFPVYDVNIKLPKEIAQNAASSQWYDEISLNKNPLKNEGRFTISAPSASNDYECQITPVQMKKDQTNILEVTFHANTFKVYMVSVMVQKPIIKKN